MSGLQLRFDVNFGPRAVRGVLAAAMFLAVAPDLASESETMTTYYPAPSGVYVQLITTENTYLARDGGSVGIGTTAPPSKLSVAGGIQAGDDSAACTVAKNGTMRWNSQNRVLDICIAANSPVVGWQTVYPSSGALPILAGDCWYGSWNRWSQGQFRYNPTWPAMGCADQLYNGGKSERGVVTACDTGWKLVTTPSNWGGGTRAACQRSAP